MIFDGYIHFKEDGIRRSKRDDHLLEHVLGMGVEVISMPVEARCMEIPLDCKFIQVC